MTALRRLAELENSEAVSLWKVIPAVKQRQVTNRERAPKVKPALGSVYFNC